MLPYFGADGIKFERKGEEEKGHAFEAQKGKCQPSFTARTLPVEERQNGNHLQSRGQHAPC